MLFSAFLRPVQETAWVKFLLLIRAAAYNKNVDGKKRITKLCIRDSSIFVNGFFNGNNFVNIIEQNSAEGIMVIGMTFLIINGYFDLSVGTLMGLCASLAVGLQPLGVLPAVSIALLVGFAVGMINGLLVAKVGINAFVVTLASMLGVRGFLYLYTQEQAIVGISDAFGDFGSGNFLGIPNLIIVFAVLLVIAQLVLRYTKHGRNTYATGGNENSASNAGINTQKTTIINFVICSLCAAAAGILYASKMNAATPVSYTHLDVYKRQGYPRGL